MYLVLQVVTCDNAQCHSLNLFANVISDVGVMGGDTFRMMGCDTFRTTWV